MDEDITSVYAEYAWKGEIGGRKSGLTVGVRYEETDVTANTNLAVPTGHRLERGQRLLAAVPGGTQADHR